MLRNTQVNGDSGQLDQVLLNFASNASDAMPDGGRLIIETENVYLDEEFCRSNLEATPGDYVCLRVSDTGQGMNEEVKAQIFDPFFTTKEVGKGTGLGLATVYGIVQVHGGFISCYSEPGRGTSFKIYLPTVESDGQKEAIQKPDMDELLGGTETVLLIDDELPLRDLGKLILSRQGYSILLADSGEQALDLYKQQGNDIDLVIMDISMPGMGGLKCIGEILKLNPQAKIMVASGYSKNGPLKDSLTAGALGYIVKPFRRAELLRAVREVLDK